MFNWKKSGGNLILPVLNYCYVTYTGSPKKSRLGLAALYADQHSKIRINQDTVPFVTQLVIVFSSSTPPFKLWCA